MHIYICK